MKNSFSFSEKNDIFTTKVANKRGIPNDSRASRTNRRKGKDFL